MANPTPPTAGSVVSIRRYPIKSMMGEEINSAEVGSTGLVGDRAYAMVDTASGKIVSAKNPKTWPKLFDFRAAIIETPQAADGPPSVRIALPDGTILAAGQSDCDAILSDALGREVTLRATAPPSPTLEEYWPDLEELEHRGTVTDEAIPEGTFFDGAAVHLMTTATIDQCRAAYPEGRFEVRRFRPNLVVETPADETGFVENRWLGQSLAIGPSVKLGELRPCPRCVMTTLRQGDLPQDSGILRTALQQNEGNVGLYASVLQGGAIHHGDEVRLVP